jgi:hypothetical protein
MAGLVAVLIGCAALAVAIYSFIVWPVAAIHAIVRWWRSRKNPPPSQML